MRFVSMRMPLHCQPTELQGVIMLVSTALALLSATTPALAASDVFRPSGGGDHAWMAYATFCALRVQDRQWFEPEIAPFIHVYTHLPDCNWNNYGTFGGWSGLPDKARTPDVRREWEICESTGWNPNTGVGRRFGHSPSGAYAAIPWYVPRIIQRFRSGEFMRPIIQLGCLSHLIQDSATFPHTQALHRSARFDVTKISIEGYEPKNLAGDVDGLVAAALAGAEAMVAYCDQQASALRAAQRAGDRAQDQRIRLTCCGEAAKVLADLYHTIIAIVGDCPRPGPPELNENLVLNPGAEEEDPGERLPRHWVVGHNDPMDRVGRAHWEGQIQRNARLWHSGKRSLKLVWPPAKGLEWRQTWPACTYVQPGDFYVASAWTRVYAATGETQVVLAFYRDDCSPLQEFASPAVAGTSDWQGLNVAAQAPPEAVRARVILRSKANPDGAAWFDDIALMRVDESTYERARSADPEEDRLVLHLPFDEDTQDHALFSGLNSPIAALSGAERATLLKRTEERGMVLTLDGQDDYVELPHSYTEDVLSPQDAMTVSLWLKADRPGPAFICGKVFEARGEARGYRLTLTEDAKLRFSVAVKGKLEAAAESAITLGKWSHIAAVRDADGTLCVFVDGQPGETMQSAGEYQPSRESFYIGADHGVADFLAGELDDLRLFRVALSAEDIAALARGE